ncbi:sodium/hydrogen antiporter [Paracoccidioides brasiliensis Pb18]|uniref:Sodium/hydrogen antiporter n=1 Tax=Paracoccidioides brasiliensis (strain Pb18) TaxID=502780 RepID=C1GEK7_PARBD|nr:sodium/hydrogen antiporter [Paracoccidioides brasiliensis Pb18]EEH49614.1 sodium/hydrogen antiporter [Paracoccidioides brasiliensis Pb18]
MAWDHLAIDKPHVAYMILGGFTSLFMLCSLFVKERLYIGEATVATLCGVIFGPHAAGLFDPISWGNVDKLTLECSRIVLVVQCFAVGVELPKSYMERHWKSVVLLLLPVMTWGWLMTSLFIWWMVPPLTWLESLACAACVTATDPVLASSVVGKGKFAKRVPKHLRDLLSAESGCNDGMAFPFIYLAVYIIEYRPDSKAVAYHWICFTILYECIFGAFFGFMIGYIGRHAIKFAERKTLIDRESFLVFYFVLALFCAGSGSLLGMDDLLIGFAAGVGFSNDGWFTEKTEASHVSNVIDLLLNLAYFVYFGAIIPWEQFNEPELGLVPWRLVVIAIFVILFRRIPIMLLLKPFISDIKSWREALFAGHFGPIGVGAIFAAILTRAELEHGTTQPLAVLPKLGEHNYTIVALIWPITTFMVISSIIVHGSSIAVFTLGKHINTLTITMSYTQANDDGPSWMNRLPRIQSQSKASLSLRKDSMESDANERLPEFSPGTLGPVGFPGNMLRRQRDDAESEPNSRASSRKPSRRRRMGAGGPISQSAITPQRRPEVSSPSLGDVTDVNQPPRGRSQMVTEGSQMVRERKVEIYREGEKVIIEDEQGNVLDVANVRDTTPDKENEKILEKLTLPQKDQTGELPESQDLSHEKTRGEDLGPTVNEKAPCTYEKIRKHLPAWMGVEQGEVKAPKVGPSTQKPQQEGRRTARAYQFGNTIIVEDADGEVIKKFTIPPEMSSRDIEEGGASGALDMKHTPFPESEPMRRKMSRVGTWVGFGEGKEGGEHSKKAHQLERESSDDARLRFTVTRADLMARPDMGRRMSKNNFINQIRSLDPKTRAELLHYSSTPEQVKAALHKEPLRLSERQPHPESQLPTLPTHDYQNSREQGQHSEQSIPTHIVGEAPRQHLISTPEAGKLSNSASIASTLGRHDSEDDGTERVPPSQFRQVESLPTFSFPQPSSGHVRRDSGETPAERKRRLAALGELADHGDCDESDNGKMESSGGPRARSRRRRRHPVIQESDSEDNGEPREVKGTVQFADGTRPARKKGGAGDVIIAPVPAYAAGSGPDGDSNEDESNENGNGGRRGLAAGTFRERSGNGNGRGHTPRVSWGGVRGRDS